MSYPGVMFNGLISAPANKGFTLNDETYTIVDSFELVGDYEVHIHDFKVMPNGHAFLLGTYPINVDMSKIVPGGRTYAELTGNVIQENDANKNVVFEWHYNISEDVVIELYKGNSFVKTIDTVYSTGSYDWEVDLLVRNGTDYSIKVRSAINETVFDISDAQFSIKN